jgi:acyl-CoA reductase-like NAD-dependent aldehyde dehydrogenase
MTKTIKCISPVDGRVYAERPCLSIADAEAMAARARAAQGPWAARPLAERIALVQAGVAKLNEMKPRIVEELAWQMGRPTRYGGEFGGVNERTAYMSEIAASALAPMIAESSERFERRIEREAIGVVFVLAPWNYPYLTAINTIVPALIAGNSVVLKHASQTLLVGERLAEAFHAAGVPADVFQNVVLDHATTEALIGARAFNFVNFTGSVAGGAAMDGAMFNAGQCCCGIERIYVHESLYDAFVQKAVAWVKALKLGNPFDADTTIGPMANARFAAVVRAQIAEAIAEGAVPLIDPALFAQDDGGAYLAPQILVNVSHDMRVMREESFGPVVGIMKVASDAEAIELMNDSPYGLTCSLWTQDAERAAAIGALVQTGTVFMNRCDYLDPALCWTGCKDTGRGGSLSVLGYYAVTRPKSYHLKKVTK